MKLYTEEQVRFITKAIYDHDFDPEKTSDELVNELTPIELPSDEEIEKKTVITFEQDDSVGKYIFGAGAKWMKEQILNQNK